MPPKSSAAPRIARSWRPIDIDRRPFLARRVVVAAMDFTAGPGFILLANQGSVGELLLDSTCAVAALK